MQIVSTNLYTAWRELLRSVLAQGAECAPRGQKIRELLHTQVTVPARSNVIVDPKRDLNYRFMIAEWLWIQAGREDVAFPAAYNSQVKQFSDDGAIFNGAYGPRLQPQWAYVLESLRRDPDSRQAVVSIWHPSPSMSKDIPCTIAAQFLLRNGELHSVWTMRSNDLWLGFPYDAFTFSQLQNGLAGELDVKTGTFTLQAGSSHLYERDWAKAETLITHASGYCLDSPPLSKIPDAQGLITWSQRATDLTAAFDEPELTYGKILRCPTKLQALRLLPRHTSNETRDLPIRPAAV